MICGAGSGHVYTFIYFINTYLHLDIFETNYKSISNLRGYIVSIRPIKLLCPKKFQHLYIWKHQKKFVIILPANPAFSILVKINGSRISLANMHSKIWNQNTSKLKLDWLHRSGQAEVSIPLRKRTCTYQVGQGLL